MRARETDEQPEVGAGPTGRELFSDRQVGRTESSKADRETNLYHITPVVGEQFAAR
jgi:hypothetical protein